MLMTMFFLLEKLTRYIAALLLYVDDMITTGDDSIGIEELKQFLCEHFEMKELESLGYLLGLNYYLQMMTCFSHRLSMFLILSLERVLLIVKLKTLLLNPTFNILLKTVLYLLMPIYQQLVGSLIYLTVTRLNISYVVHIVRQLMSSPCTTHYVVVLQII
jgi:hypothetical protein